MAISPGARLGPYEVIGPLGAGGMGEVYRARDPRLARDVAIKVLPTGVASDPERLKRFETEARSASSLNHPNIVTIYDIGSAESVSYIAMELVGGEPLRAHLESRSLAVREILRIGTQIAEGLARAHASGIVHRDLKPENVMVTEDGHVKILDFGVAKLTQAEPGGAATAAATVSGTQEGMIVGTVGYMSPEQAAGRAIDYRSDQFSLGSILYEMATGRRAFERASKPQTLAAIIQDEPESIGSLNPKIPAPVRWIVERCLSKEPRSRYTSTEDLARELATVRDRISEATTSGASVPVGPARARARGVSFLAVVALLFAAGLSYWAGTRRTDRRPPFFHRLTFRRGQISGARFSPDGQTIVYSAAWDGKPLETHLMRRESSDSRSLGFSGAHLWSLSSRAEMALGLNWRMQGPYVGRGTLARVSLAGGAPREVLEKVEQADWSPDGKSLAVVRVTPNKLTLEFPVGRTVYETTDGPIYGIRVSPGEDLVAFIQGNPARVSVVDRSGKKKELSSGWFRAQGLAWSAKGDEVWFTASKAGHGRALRAVSLSGRERLLTQVPGRLTIHDIARDGSVLTTHEDVRREMVGLAPGESRERDLTWLGFSWPIGLSRDGRTVFFLESSEESPLCAYYIRKIDEPAPTRIGEGICQDFAEISPDGRWVFARQPAPGGERYELMPTGAGDPRPLAIRGLEDVGYVKWFPDGEHLLVVANAPGGKPRDFLIDLVGGQPRPLTPENISESVISPDGKSLLNMDDQDGLSIYPVEGGPARRVVEKSQGRPMQWSADGKSVYLWHPGQFNRVDKLDLASGRMELWKEFQPSDPTGVLVVQPMLLAPDGKSYVYTFVRVLSDLYLVEGLK